MFVRIWQFRARADKVLRAWSEDYAALDEVCGGLTVTEAEIGVFRIVAE